MVLEYAHTTKILYYYQTPPYQTFAFFFETESEARWVSSNVSGAKIDGVEVTFEMFSSYSEIKLMRDLEDRMKCKPVNA